MTNVLIVLGFFLAFILTYLGRGYWGWVLAGAAWLGACRWDGHDKLYHRDGNRFFGGG
jgi:hypothetical protein